MSLNVSRTLDRPLIGRDWSRDINTDIWLVSISVSGDIHLRSRGRAEDAVVAAVAVDDVGDHDDGGGAPGSCGGWPPCCPVHWPGHCWGSNQARGTRSGKWIGWKRENMMIRYYLFHVCSRIMLGYPIQCVQSFNWVRPLFVQINQLNIIPVPA